MTGHRRRGAAPLPDGRVADLLERITRVELGVVVVAPPDAERMAARDRARAAADRGGPRAAARGRHARPRARSTMRSFARAGFSGTWAATDMAVSVARSGDRVAAAAAFEEAATAAVVEDLVDAETLETSALDLGRARPARPGCRHPAR